MNFDYPQKPKPKKSQNQPEWHQPLIPGMEEFMAQLNQNLKASPNSQSK